MKDIINLFYNFFKQHKFSMIINSFYSIAIPINDVLLPHLYGNIINSLEKKKSVLMSIIIIIIVIIIVQLGQIISDLSDTKLFPKIQEYIRINMIESIFNKNETNYNDLLIGDIMSSIVKIPSNLIAWYERIKCLILPYIIVYTISIFYFIYYDKLIGFCLLILIIFYILLVIGAPFFCKNKSLTQEIKQNNLFEEISDIINNLLSIYTANKEQSEINRIIEFENSYKISYTETMNCIIKIRFIIIPIIIAFLIIFFYQCIKKIKEKKIQIATFISLFMILLYILNSMLILVDHIRNMVFEYGVLSNYTNLFKYDKLICNKNIPEKTQIPTEGIYLHNVIYSYSVKTNPVLYNINLYINKGEKIGILGDIGSGKSTILKLLLKLYSVNSGQIYLDGVSYDKLNIHDIRRKIGYIPQQPILFNRTVLENIKYNNPDITDEQIYELLFTLGLQDEFTQLENGLNTKIGKNGSKLSGGRRQLIWSLRVLLSNPEILILDEPTASLDENIKQLLIKLYDHFMANKTIILVTHDQTLMNYANRIIYLKDGQIINDYYVENRNT